MPRIRWDDTMRFGVAELDDLHQDLTAVVADLAEAHLRGSHQELLADMAEELYDLARHVFAVEEEFMAEHRYDQAAGHQAEHAAFLHDCATPLLAFADGEGDLTAAQLEDLGGRWLAHLAGADRRLAEALAGSPGQGPAM